MLNLSNGSLTPICELPFRLTAVRGIAWSEKGQIVFGLSGSSLRVVPQDGGDPKVLRPLNDEAAHTWPQFLPGGKQVLYVANRDSLTGIISSLEVMNIDTLEVTRLQIESPFARYSPSGHLLYMNGDDIYAMGFDLEQLKVQGKREKVVENVETSTSGGAAFHVAYDGTLAYLSKVSTHEKTFVWFDVQSDLTPKAVTELSWTGWTEWRPSPNGKNIAYSRLDGSVYVIPWMTDDISKIREPLEPPGKSWDISPIWAPDGKSIYFYSERNGKYGVWRKNVGVSAPQAELMYSINSRMCKPVSVTSDENFLFVSVRLQDPKGPIIELRKVSLSDGVEQVVFSHPNNAHMDISSNGEFVAYHSSQRGIDEIYVKSLSANGQSERVTPTGTRGYRPWWSLDGSELYYLGSMDGLSWRVVFSSSVSQQNGVLNVGNPKPFLILPESCKRLLPIVTRDKKRIVMHGPLDVIGETNMPPV